MFNIHTFFIYEELKDIDWDTKLKGCERLFLLENSLRLF